MRNVGPAPAADLDAETEKLGGSDDDGDTSDSKSASDMSSDYIPDDFMGVPDVPPYDGSSSSVSWISCFFCMLWVFLAVFFCMLSVLLVV